MFRGVEREIDVRECAKNGPFEKSTQIYLPFFYKYILINLYYYYYYSINK